MKKLTLAVLALALTLGFVGRAHAVCDGRTTTCLTAIDVSGNATVGSLTNTGSATTGGSSTVTGSMTIVGAASTGGSLTYGTYLVPASSTVVISAAGTQVTPLTSYVVLSPNGLAVATALTGTPTISTATALGGQTAYTDGQWLVVSGTSSITTLKLQDNGTLSGSRLYLGNGNTYTTVSSTVSAAFVYNASNKGWNFLGTR